MDNSQRLNSKLYKNIPKENRETYVKQMELLFDIIEPVTLTLQQEIDTIVKTKTNEKDFDCSGWAFKQAHLNGQIQALQLVISLLTLKNNKDNK